MKRSEALAQLSRDHQHGLAIALKLRRADDATAADARTAFLAFWEREGRAHFREEEEVLLPALARHHDPAGAAVVRVLVEHVDLRRRAADVAADDGVGAADLRELGVRLHDHIRHEERNLFPLVEAALGEAGLVALAAAMDGSGPRPER